MPPEPNTPSAIEQAVSRALRDNLERIQRTSDELHQAIADVVAACGSSKPANALPPMLRAQTSAASLSAVLEVLSRFVAVTLQPGPRSPFEAEIARIAGSIAVPEPAAAEPAAAHPEPVAAERRTCAGARVDASSAPPVAEQHPAPAPEAHHEPHCGTSVRPEAFEVEARAAGRRARQKTRARSTSAACRPRNRNYTAAQIESRKFRCKILKCYVRSRCGSAGSTKISASDCVMTLRKLIENTTGGSSPSWTTRWIIFIAGWWRSSLRATRMPSATILTPRPAPATRRRRVAHSAEFSRGAAR